MKLRSLPQDLDIEGCKGYFPHFFNAAENQSYVGPLLPPGNYGVGSMMLEEKKHFLAWHTASQEKLLDFQKT